jgi:hypothetical protein
MTHYGVQMQDILDGKPRFRPRASLTLRPSQRHL